MPQKKPTTRTQTTMTTSNLFPLEQKVARVFLLGL